MAKEQDLTFLYESQQELLKTVRELANARKEVKESEKVYALSDLEKIFRVSRRTLFTWKQKGKLTFGQIGKKLYVTQQELEKFINNLNKGGLKNGR